MTGSRALITSSLLIPMAIEQGISDPHISYELSVGEGGEQADLFVDLKKLKDSGMDITKINMSDEDVTWQILGNVIRQHDENSEMAHFVIG